MSINSSNNIHATSRRDVFNYLKTHPQTKHIPCTILQGVAKKVAGKSMSATVSVLVDVFSCEEAEGLGRYCKNLVRALSEMPSNPPPQKKKWSIICS